VYGPDHRYERFLKDYGLGVGNARPLEIARALWTTSSNIGKHYKVLEDTLLEAGLAVVNEGFDPNKPFDEPIKITKPERIFSFDETRIQMDMADAKFTCNRLKIVVDKSSGLSGGGVEQKLYALVHHHVVQRLN
jgi:hypothetical protein